MIIPGEHTCRKVLPKTGLRGYERKKHNANYVTRSFLHEKKRYYGASDLIAHMQQMVDAEPLSVTSEFDQFPLDIFEHRGQIDRILMDGALDGGKLEQFFTLCGKVGGSLISDFSLRADTAVANDHRSQFEQCCGRIDKKARDFKSTKTFDGWFKNEREHSFVRCFKSTPAIGKEARAKARKLGKAFFRVILWLSYEMMSALLWSFDVSCMAGLLL